MVNRNVVPLAVVAVVGATLTSLGLLYAKNQEATNKIALAAGPKGVTALAVEATSFRPSRRYVGTLQPWLVARLGPQVVSAHVEQVMVRPGDVVKKGALLASLDCRKVVSSGRVVAMQARAAEARQKAIASEATRMKALQDKGFASENEVEQRQAQSAAEQAQLMALRSQQTGKQIESDDCTLNAPFDGEVSERLADPGAFARPGAPVVTLIDRHIVRLSVDVPEVDHEAIAPGTQAQIRLLAGGRSLRAAVSRRSPAADAGSRTIHAEIDLEDPERRLPVGTTAEVIVEVGAPLAAWEIPASAAKIRGSKASFFVVDGEVARGVSAEVLGESGGSVFVKPALPGKVFVVTEGRSLLIEGDRVAMKVEARGKSAPAASSSAPPPGSSAPPPPPPPQPPPVPPGPTQIPRPKPSPMPAPTLRP